MNRKTLITLLAVAAVLIGGIVAGVLVLYRGGGEDAGRGAGNVSDRFPVLVAVPSDATAVFCLSDFRKGTALLVDETKAFGALVSAGKNQPYIAFFNALNAESDGRLSALKSQPMAVSLHYSGSVVPLVEISVPRSYTDSTSQICYIREAAAAAGLSFAFHSSKSFGTVLVSSSETLIGSSVRHQDEGISILSNKDMAAAAKASPAADALFISNTYASKLLPAFFKKTVTRSSSFIKNVAEWTVFGIESSDAKSVTIKGAFACEDITDYFSGVLSAQRPSVPSFQKIVPSETVFCASLQTDSHETYLSSYRQFLDAASKLNAYSRTLAELKSTVGTDPTDWAKSLAVKEVAKARWRAEGTVRQAVFVRAGKKDSPMAVSTSEPQPYRYAGFASALFGPMFAVEEETHCFCTGEWIVSGSEADITDFAARYAAGDALQSLFADASVPAVQLTKPCTFAGYFSACAYPSDEIFASPTSSFIERTMNGATWEPCLMTCSGRTFQIEVTRAGAFTKANVPAVAADASVEIPSGPFEVKNSGTGRTNLLSQADNGSITLREQDGTAQWSIPFTERLCGSVETIDFYANGKLQFLFAAGSKLYLLDRLGRFVTGFPVELVKDVLLGPAVYDFTGAKGYTAMVLFKDNTIGLFNLHGQTADSWKGITSDEKIIALPQLLDMGGTKYWIVRTASRTQIFPFHGGDPVLRQDGAKSIRRDAEIQPVDNTSVKALCNDGKTRTLKLQ